MLWANDDLFAEKENLIKPGPAEHRPATFGHKGQVYDGWENRRRRGVTGNYPPQISAEAAYVVGHPPVEELVEKTQ